MKMDSIILRGLVLYGCHGVLAQEKNNHQKFVVDLELFLDLKEAAASDALEATVDYGEVFQLVRGLVEDRSFNLLETLAEQICQAILARYPVEKVKIAVQKPHAPIDGEFDYFAVSIIRNR